MNLTEYIDKEFENQEKISTQGFAITESSPMIFDDMSLRVQPNTVWRFESNTGRYYYEFLDSMRTIPRFGVGVTSSVASFKVLPMSKFLIEWHRQFRTEEEANAAMKKAGDYGTFIHILNQNFFINRSLNLDIMPELVKTFREKAFLQYDNTFWIDRAKKDLVAMRNWAIEFSFKPIAVELMLIGSEGYATAVDAIGYITIGSGQGGRILKNDVRDGKTKEVLGIFDWKTSKGFYHSHAIQLEACKRLVEENLPEFKGKIQKLYNVAPKGEKKLECDLKDQTNALKTIRIGEFEFNEFDVYLAQYKTNYPNFNKPKSVNLITGTIRFDEEDDLQVINESPEAIVIEKHRTDFLS